jgi:hypothetical protein
MKNITHHTGKLEVIQRMPSSFNGNPRYLLRIDGHTCCTAVDSMHGYSVTNYDGQIVQATIGTHYGRATLNTIKIAQH